MKMKQFAFSLLFFISVFISSAQNADSRWVFGLHLASAIYKNADGDKIEGSFISQAPRGSIAMYFKNGFTLEGALSLSALDAQQYTTFDGAILYDFGSSDEKVVPYVLLGGSFISAKSLTPTLNFGAGNTFWIFPNYGLNIQLMYKYSQTKFGSQFSHFYPSVGIIYSPKPRNLRPSSRLWDKKH